MSRPLFTISLTTQRLLALALVGALVAGATIVGADAPAKVAGQVRMTDGGISTDAINTTSLITSYDPKGAYNVIVTTDGTNVIARTAQGFLISNSTTAATTLQAAIDSLPTAGGRIYIAAGNYSITTTLTLRSGVALTGAGLGSILFLANNTNADMIRTTGEDNQNIELSHLFLNGNGGGQTSGDILDLEGALYALITDVYFLDPKGAAVRIQRTDIYDGILNRISHNVFRTNIESGYAVEFNVATDNLLESNSIQNIGTGSFRGVYINGGGSRIVDNHIVKTRESCLTLVAAAGSSYVVMGNVLDTCYQHGIMFNVTAPNHIKNVKVIGNQIMDVGYDAGAGVAGTYDCINIDTHGYARNNIINGNSCFRQSGSASPKYRWGVNLGTNSGANVVTGNTFEDYQTGTWVDNGTTNFLFMAPTFDSGGATATIGSSTPYNFRLLINGSIEIKNQGAGGNPLITSNSSQKRMSIGADTFTDGFSAPASDNTRDLGLSTNRWKTAFLSGAVYITAASGDTHGTTELSPTALEFGVGGSSAPDTCINRAAADTIGVCSGDHLRISTTGQLQWGTDVTLSRSGANEIAMGADDDLKLGTGLDWQPVTLGTCNSAARGEQAWVEGGAGVADALWICAKKADDSYAWREITLV